MTTPWRPAWGSIVVPIGYTDPVNYPGGGNPYGVSYSAPMDSKGVTPEVLAAARYHGRRVAQFAELISKNLGQLLPTQAEAAAGAQAAKPDSVPWGGGWMVAPALGEGAREGDE